MNFGFWNINGKKLDEAIKEFVKVHEIDILILGESPYEPIELLLKLNNESSDYYYAPNIICEKIQFYTRFKPELFELVTENHRICARKLFSPKHGNITLIAAHYNSKVNWAAEDQAAHIPNFKALIDTAENIQGHERTIVCGDFNMNPFDFGMVQSTGLHSVMDKRIAMRKSRIVDGHEYKFFYNPMWAFLGDTGRGSVSGSLYYSPAKPICYHWHLYDQVIIRPDLIPDFEDDALEIVTEIGSAKLLTKNFLISSSYSDHLPIKFKINI